MRYAKVFVMVTVLAIAGCGATSGTKITEDQLSRLKVGETTRAQAVSILGEPNSDTAMSGGARILVWVYSSTSVRPETFIPFAGAFVGGADNKSSSVVLTFGSNDVLERTGASNTNVSSSLSR